MKLAIKKHVLLSLLVMLLLIGAAGCGIFIAGNSETEDAMAGEHGELPEWLSLSSHTLRDADEELDEAKDSGELEEQVDPNETEGAGLVPEESPEIPEATTSQPSAESPQQEQSQAEQESSGAEPGTMEWIEEQQKQREAAERAREQERIQEMIEEAEKQDESQGGWWNIYNQNIPGIEYELGE
jgi:hypothetical protein